jgi:G:T-mismatch repair DNA endonuclease (very short patch repair protein)
LGKRKQTLKTNREYWIPKIERNITRDNKIEKELENMGWVVLRFWGNEITKKLSDCIDEIKEIIYEIKSGIYYKEDNSNDSLVAEEEQTYNIESDNITI